jgi:GNAT superfamily N-acetyltransferase
MTETTQRKPGTVRVEPLHAMPRSPDQLEHLLDGGWPEFISADASAAASLPTVRERFADLELLAVDGHRYVGAGWAVPLAWDGEIANLPEGYADSLRRALDTADSDATPNTLVVCAAQVDQTERGRGVARALLNAFRNEAVSRGYSRLIVPLRPTQKSAYPLTPIDEYAAWTRPDGLPFDPWLRTHLRMGARVIATAPTSQVMTGSVDDWEKWTRMKLPAPGDYVIPGGLAVLTIDGAGEGRYVEPNIWVEHPLPRMRAA